MKTPNLRRFLGWIVVIGWLLVSAVFGLLPTEVRGKAGWGAELYRYSHLFRNNQGAWVRYWADVRLVNSDSWQSVTELTDLPLARYGGVGWLHRVLSRGRKGTQKDLWNRELALWLKQRIETKTGREVTGVRFLSQKHDVAEEYPPDERWDVEPSADAETTAYYEVAW